jgi:hypothetical protein
LPNCASFSGNCANAGITAKSNTAIANDLKILFFIFVLFFIFLKLPDSSLCGYDRQTGNKNTIFSQNSL